MENFETILALAEKSFKKYLGVSLIKKKLKQRSKN